MTYINDTAPPATTTTDYEQWFEINAIVLQ